MSRNTFDVTFGVEAARAPTGANAALPRPRRKDDLLHLVGGLAPRGAGTLLILRPGVEERERLRRAEVVVVVRML